MANVSLVDGHIDQEEYIVDYEDRRFKSYWNEMCELWSVYQSKLQDDGRYKLEVRFLCEKPIATIEDAKEKVENWLKMKQVIFDDVKSMVGEPKKAEWIISGDGYYPYCSNCGYEPERPQIHSDNRTKYCPNCGFEMKKE